MATPVKSIDTFQVNTGSAEGGNQWNPQIIGLADGRFMVAWSEDGAGSIHSGYGNDVVGKFFTSTGTLSIDSTGLNTLNTYCDIDNYEIAPLSDGGFALTYRIHLTPTWPEWNAIYWEAHDGSNMRTAFDDHVAWENAGGQNLYDAQVAINLNNDQSFVAFRDMFGSQYDTRAVRLNLDGSVATSEFDAGTNTASHEYSEDIAVLKNGNLVSVYAHNAAEYRARLAICRPDGTLIEDRMVDPSGSQYGAQVTSLKNGGFVVTWHEIAASANVHYRVFDRTGDAVTGVKKAAATGDQEHTPAIVALPDGDFVIAWDNDTDNRLEARCFNADGTRDGDRFTVHDGAVYNSDLGVTADGRILFTWQDTASLEIMASVWDPRGSRIEVGDFLNMPRNFLDGGHSWVARPQGGTLVGTPGADQLTGMNAQDILIGRGGADNIRGAGAGDTIRAGAGNDTVDGGNGADRVEGGVGDDWLYGNNGNDKLLGDDGRDTIIGANGKDTLKGGSGNDVLYGSNGDDVLKGGNGADDLYGLWDNDRLVGGNGNDAFVFHSFGKGNADVITDFGNGDDEIHLEDFYFTAITARASGYLKRGEFHVGTDAADANDHIIYNEAKGKLFYDVDGRGGADKILFAEVDDGTDLSANDFFVV